MPKKTEKQRKPIAPRWLTSSEVLVIFAVDAAEPEIDDDWFDNAFQGFASELASQGVWFGSWKTLRVPELRIEVARGPGEATRFPGALLEELQLWDRKQKRPDLMRIVRIFKFSEIKGYAFVIHVPED